jgi:hypothetical protein
MGWNIGSVVGVMSLVYVGREGEHCLVGVRLLARLVVGGLHSRYRV